MQRPSATVLVAIALGRGACARQPAVEGEAHVEIRHVVFGDQHRSARVDLRRPATIERGRERAALGPQLGDGVLQHLLIKLDPDFADVTRLLLAQ